MGWLDEVGANSRVLIWIWKKAPSYAVVQPTAGSFCAFQLPATALAECRKLHKQCRHELARLDSFTGTTLSATRIALDTLIARSLTKSTPPSDRSTRFEVAIQWMRQNLAAQHPVSELAVYLGLSESTLQRLFIECCDLRPFAVFQRMKGERAQELLKSGMSIKAVAYSLGYKHPNDFTRFFRKTFNHPPTQTQSEAASNKT